MLSAGVESRFGDAARPRLALASRGSCDAGPRRPVAAPRGRGPRHPLPDRQLRLAAAARPEGEARGRAREDVQVRAGPALPADPVRRPQRDRRRRRRPATATTGSGPTSTAPSTRRARSPRRIRRAPSSAGAGHRRHRRTPTPRTGRTCRRAGTRARTSMRKTVELVHEMEMPLYVILVGDPVGEVTGQDRERAPGLILDMVRAANGAAAARSRRASPRSSRTTACCCKKFVFRVAPAEGLKKIEPVVKRIAAPPRPADRARFFGYFVLPLLVILIAAPRASWCARSPARATSRSLELAARPARARRRGQIRLHSPTAGWSAPGPEPGGRLAGRPPPPSPTSGASLDLTRRRARHDRPRPARRGAARRSTSTSCAGAPSRPRPTAARARRRSTRSTSTTWRRTCARRRRSGCC